MTDFGDDTALWLLVAALAAVLPLLHRRGRGRRDSDADDAQDTIQTWRHDGERENT